MASRDRVFVPTGRRPSHSNGQTSGGAGRPAVFVARRKDTVPPHRPELLVHHRDAPRGLDLHRHLSRFDIPRGQLASSHRAVLGWSNQADLPAPVRRSLVVAAGEEVFEAVAFAGEVQEDGLELGVRRFGQHCCPNLSPARFGKHRCHNRGEPLPCQAGGTRNDRTCALLDTNEVECWGRTGDLARLGWKP
jgi:hypothetical protein